MAGDKLSGLMLFASETTPLFAHVPLSQRNAMLIDIWHDLSHDERQFYIDLSKKRLSSRQSPVERTALKNIVYPRKYTLQALRADGSSSYASGYISHENAASETIKNVSNILSETTSPSDKNILSKVKRYVAERFIDESKEIPEDDTFVRRLFDDSDIAIINENIRARKRKYQEIAGSSGDPSNESTANSSSPRLRRVPQLLNHFIQNRSHPVSCDNKIAAKPNPQLYSRFKGVVRKTPTTWHASIYISKECPRLYIGTFDNEIKAAKAYDEMARKIYGKSAITNFSEDGKRAFQAFNRRLPSKVVLRAACLRQQNLRTSDRKEELKSNLS
jgi:hypothetical protein